MKKIPVVFSVAFLIITSAGAYSQTYNKFKADISKFKEPASEGTNAPDMNSKVMKSFNKLFSDAKNIIWTNDKKNNHSVYFERQGKVTRAAFTKNGELMHAVSTYTEECLPKEILFQVKDTYFGKSIFGVTEVQVLDKTAYLIILEDKTSWLHIKVLDGDISEEGVWLK
jgi:hypothetical protein